MLFQIHWSLVGIPKCGMKTWPTPLLWPPSVMIFALILREEICSLFTHMFLRFSLFPTTITTKSFQSCPTLCDPIDGSPPGFPIPGILQARILEWVAICFSSAWKWKVKVKLLSRVQLFMTPWTVDYQAPLSMGFPRQEYWSGVPLPSLWRDIKLQ